MNYVLTRMKHEMGDKNGYIRLINATVMFVQKYCVFSISNWTENFYIR